MNEIWYVAQKFLNGAGILVALALPCQGGQREEDPPGILEQRSYSLNLS